jgi:hypothetical protein
MENQQANFVRFMSRHLVSLAGIYESYKDGKLFQSGTFAVSGFVLTLHDRHFWVTAGHCLKYLDDNIRNGVLKIFDVGFADYFGDEAKDQHKYPFSYEPGCGFYIDSQEDGLDFAIIPLDLLTIQNFAANGVKDVSRANWLQQPALTFERYMILGLPAYLIPKDRPAVQPVLVGIEPLKPSDIPDPLPDEWFVGKIDDECPIVSIEGMSGGPIYGFRRDDKGRWLYHIVALQSRWREGSRVIFGCPMTHFAELLYQQMIESGTAFAGDDGQQGDSDEGDSR